MFGLFACACWLRDHSILLPRSEMASVSSYRSLAQPACSPQHRSQARQASRRRQQPPVALLGGLLQLPLLGREAGGSAAGSKVAAARRRLLEQLSSQRPDRAVISEACDELMAAQVPFREADLGGGPWQVRSVQRRAPGLQRSKVCERLAMAMVGTFSSLDAPCATLSAGGLYAGPAAVAAVAGRHQRCRQGPHRAPRW